MEVVVVDVVVIVVERVIPLSTTRALTGVLALSIYTATPTDLDITVEEEEEEVVDDSTGLEAPVRVFPMRVVKTTTDPAPLLRRRENRTPRKRRLGLRSVPMRDLSLVVLILTPSLVVLILTPSLVLTVTPLIPLTEVSLADAVVLMDLDLVVEEVLEEGALEVAAEAAPGSDLEVPMSWRLMCTLRILPLLARREPQLPLQVPR
jgi:hypothetical protein